MNVRNLILFCPLLVCTSAIAADRPNILFIMSDDHTAQAIGAYATLLKELNPTPTIDTLAAEGICFDNAFCTNAICTPSRACIITGQYNHNNGVFDLGGSILPPNQTLPILMRDAGYQTAIIGKWHLKVEPNFDYYKVLPGQGKYFDTEFRIQGDKPWPKNTIAYPGSHSSDVITDSSLDWFQHHRDPDKPFFVCHQYKAPHDYFESNPRYDNYLADVDIPEPVSAVEQTGYVGLNRHSRATTVNWSHTLVLRSAGAIHAARTLPTCRNNSPTNSSGITKTQIFRMIEVKRLAYQAYLKKYLRCVKGVDDNLKRLFDYLKQENLYDNTVIIYTGDQGFWLGERDYQDKRWAYDASQRMPFIVRYPKTIPAGIRSDAIVENVDYPALMLDFAGVDVPSSMQGRSFRSICETGQEPEDWKQAAYYRYWMHMAHHDNPGEMAIRTKTHKLIYFYGCDYQGENQTPPAWELYDLVKDPEELRNVYDDPAYASIRDELEDTVCESCVNRLVMTVRITPKCEKVVQEFWDYDEADRQKAITISAEFLELREATLAGRKK